MILIVTATFKNSPVYLANNPSSGGSWYWTGALSHAIHFDTVEAIDAVFDSDSSLLYLIKNPRALEVTVNPAPVATFSAERSLQSEVDAAKEMFTRAQAELIECTEDDNQMFLLDNVKLATEAYQKALEALTRYKSNNP